jgi:hypothetical protein
MTQKHGKSHLVTPCLPKLPTLLLPRPIRDPISTPKTITIEPTEEVNFQVA